MLRSYSLHYSRSERPCLTTIERMKLTVYINKLLPLIHEENEEEIASLLDQMGPIASDFLHWVHKQFSHFDAFHEATVKEAFCSFDFENPATIPYLSKLNAVRNFYKDLMYRWSGQIFTIPTLGLNCEGDYEKAGIEPLLASDTEWVELFQPLIDLSQEIDACSSTMRFRLDFPPYERWRVYGFVMQKDLETLIDLIDNALFSYPSLDPPESRWQDGLFQKIGIYPISWEGFKAHAEKLQESFLSHFENEEMLEFFLKSREGYQWVDETKAFLADFNAFTRKELLKKWRLERD